MATIVSTFFSYKGGAGRSTTCLNTLPFLVRQSTAHKSAPILLLDMDIESAGMTYLLNQQDKFHGKFDVKELLKNEETWSTEKKGDITLHPLYKKFVPVGRLLGLPSDESVMFLGVDDASPKLDGRYMDTYEGAIKKLIEFADRHNVRAIVMDSAAGDQFSATVAVRKSEKIVFCMRPTHQFRIGTFNYLKRLSISAGRTGADKTIVLLPTVVPADAAIEGKSQLELAIDDIKKRIDSVGNFDFKKNFVSSKDCFGINEVARFKWKEGVLYKLKAENGTLAADEEEGYVRYQKLAEVIWKD